MKCWSKEESCKREIFPSHDFQDLLTTQNGCVAGCHAGILSYRQIEFLQGGTHEDQEGFFVLEGSGFARVGGETFPLRPGTAFLAPAGVPHFIRRDDSCEAVKLFFFHAAV